MEDRQKALTRITELLRDHEDAIPYLVGYLGAHLETPVLERAVQSYLEFDEDLGIMQAASRLAEQAKFESPEVP